MKNLLLLLLLIPLFGLPQTKPVGTIAFYNLENLFDTENDPEINDEEFLPEGRNEWTAERYQSKLNNMSRVLAALPGPPDIVGVSEIENRRVLEDLVTTGNLAPFGYQIVHFDSPDRRGIDVGLLYIPGRFIPFYSETIPVKDQADPGFFTRDILFVKGLYQGDTLNIFVNHWPSRLGGKEDKRILAASTLRSTVDSIQAVYPQAKIVIMGDLNDDPRNRSVKKVLVADNKEKGIRNEELYNASGDLFQQGYGTLRYRGIWNMFDQIIVSRSMLQDHSETFFYIPDSFQVFAADWMQIKEGDNRGGPYRSFLRGVWQNGYSDHYPPYIVIGK